MTPLNFRKTIWGPERDEALKAMVAKDLSAAAMAGLLGCSRNAVLGRLYRLRGRGELPASAQTLQKTEKPVKPSQARKTPTLPATPQAKGV